MGTAQRDCPLPTQQIGVTIVNIATDKRSAIVDGAAVLFRRCGYQATTLADLSDATGMNKGSLFYFFPAKSDILFAIYLATFEALDSHVDAIPGGLRADENLRAHIHAMVSSTLSRPDHVAVYFQEHQWIERTLNAEQAAVIRSQEEFFTARLGSIVEDAVAGGIFRDVNVKLLVTQIQATVQSSYRWHLKDKGLAPSAIADAIADTFIHGVLTAKFQQPPPLTN